MIDEKLSDEEIRELWAEHYPKRLGDIKSKALCEVFRLVVEQRAADTANNDVDLLVKVHDALARFGIPRDEFYQVEKERSEND